MSLTNIQLHKLGLENEILCMRARLEGVKQYVGPPPPYDPSIIDQAISLPVTVDRHGVVVTQEELEQYARNCRELEELNNCLSNDESHDEEMPNTIQELKVVLTYFKPNGKYYSEGNYITKLKELHDIRDEVRNKRKEGKLPEIQGTHWIVSVDVPDHRYNHPHLIV